MSAIALQPERERTNQITLGLLITVFTCLVCFYAIGNARIERQLDAWHLRPTADHYTALAFSRPTALPSVSSKTPQSFTFSIANNNGDTESFPYQVTSTTNLAPAKVLATGTVKLAAGETINRTVTFTFPAKTPRTEIKVELPGQDQEIHFWLGASS